MYSSWIILVACTVWLALLGFFWGLADGQFSDQNRARYLPLAGVPWKSSSDRPPWKGKERYLFLFVSGAVLAVCGAALFLSLASR